jgi:hypothetical protein
MSSMLEQFHGLKSREHAPNKRRKVDDPEIGENESKPNGTSERIETNGMLGHALREEQRKLQETLPVRSSSVVDLTGKSLLLALDVYQSLTIVSS